MKRLTLYLTCVALCFVFITIPVGTVEAQQTSPLQVGEGKICTDVVDRTCQNANTRFPVFSDTLFCFTRILGAEDDTSVTHVWYFNDIERARVNLSVRSPNWRTFSSKIIQPQEIGAWHVNVLNADGQVLTVIPFEVTR